MAGTEVRGDARAAVDFLQRWSPDEPWVLVAIDPESKRTDTATFGGSGRAREAAEWVEARQGRVNVYFTVNTVRAPMSVKPKKEHMRGLRALHIDLDPRAGEDLEQERARVRRLLEEFSPAPSIIIDSGGGCQGFWLLAAEVPIGSDGPADLEAYNIQLEVLLGADACHNIDRIMRLPGTVNVPDEKKRRKGRKPALARLVRADWQLRYPLGDFTPAVRVQASGGGGPQVKLSGNLPQVDLQDLERVPDRVKALIVNGDDPDDPTRYPSRSEALWAVLCELVRCGCDDDTIAAIVLDPDYGISGHVLDQSRPQQYAARQIKRAREHAIDPSLQELNELHAVIEDIGGRCRVISEVLDPVLGRRKITRQSFDDFRNRYMHRRVTVGTDKSGNPIEKPLGAWWLQNEHRRQYRHLVFAPGHEVSDCYNLWKGFACEARPGDCSLYLTHLRENVCRGVMEWYDYLLSWMARAVQQPASQGEVAIVMRGRMGAGKGFAIKEFGRLWGQHFLQVTDPKHLVGSFNSHLRDCVVLFGDEAFFAGDRRHAEILKTMISEDMLMVESKGVDAEAAPNFLHVLMASNNDWVVPAGLDERRFFLLDVGDGKMQDGAYFARIRAQMDSGGREALLHLLLTRDISSFDVRAFPRTAALQDQKLLSMSPEEQWWHEKLMDGRLLRHRDDHWPEAVVKDALQRDYVRWADDMRLIRRMSPTAMGKFLSRVMPGDWPRSFQDQADVEELDRDGRPTVVRRRAWCYRLPPLEVCRGHWDDRFGGPYAWPNDHP